MKKLTERDFNTFYKVNEFVAKTTPMRTHYNSPSGLERWLWGEKKRIVKKFLGELAYSNIIDIGCGDGGLYPVTNAKSNYTGIDISPTQLGYFKTLIPRSRRNKTVLRKADVSKMPFKKNSFDVALCCDVLEHVLDPRKVFLEIKRVVKPGGHIIMSIPNEYFLQLARLVSLRFPLKSPDHLYALDVGDVQNVFPRVVAVRSIPFVVVPPINIMSIIFVKNEK